MGNDIKKAADDAIDAIHEVGHRTNASVEHVKRDIAGNTMTTGEKVKSFVHEDVESTKADVDKAKRVIRDRT
jgi:hypothetical protein